MAISKQQKVEILKDLTQKFTDSVSIGFATTNTMSVDDFGGLRDALREVGSTYSIAKKTLIAKAMKDALDVDIDLEMLPGQIGVVCSSEDAVSGLGKVNELVKKTKGEKITWAAGYMEGQMMSADEIKALAGLPSREVLLGQLVGVIQAPLQKLAGTLDATVSGFVRVTKAAGDKAQESGKEALSELSA